VDSRDTESSAVVVGEKHLFSLLNSAWAVWFYLAAGWLFGLPLSVPTSLTEFDPSWDPSWQYGLAWAAELGMTHGHSFVFNLGPLGFLFHPVLAGSVSGPALFGLRVILRAGVAIAFGLEACRAEQRGRISMVPIAALAVSLALLSTNDLVVVATVLFLGRAIVRGAWMSAAIGGVVGGVMLLAKFNNGIQCLATMIVLAVASRIGAQPIRGLPRAIAGAFVGFVLTLLVAWILGLVALGPFLLESWRLASAYTQLSIARSAEDLLAFLALLFLLIMLLHAVLVASAADRWSLLTWLPAGFLFYKSALIRSDDLHMAWGGLGFVALAAGVSLRVHNPRLSGQLRAAILVGLVLSLLSAQRLGLISVASWTVKAREVALALGREPQATRGMTFWTAAGENTVDVYPDELELLAPVRERWVPRYVFQTYANLHPALDLKTARQIHEGRSAEWILFRLKLLDQTHPALGEPAVWSALAEHYDLGPSVEDRPDALWLVRGEGRIISERTGDDSLLPVGPWQALPEGTTRVRLTLRIRRTFLGTLYDLAFKAPPPMMQVEFSDGEVRSYHFNWRNARNGMIVSHLPRTPAEARAWFGGTMPRNVRRIRLALFSRSFSQRVAARWSLEAASPDPQTSQR